MYKNSAKEYNKVSLETEVMEADPHKLIQMLLDGALTRLAAAKTYIEAKNYALKNERLGKAIDIICALQESLDHEKGGEVSANLEALYDYITRRIFEANAHNDINVINEVMALLVEVKSGWEGIRDQYVELRQSGQIEEVKPQGRLSV